MNKSSYDEQFYQQKNDGSYKSAVYYADQLLRLIRPSSIIDVGCGRGAWLKAFKEKGVKNLKGIDGSWNRQELMLDPEISFTPVDLNYLPNPDRQYDLAICLEVAEHLRPESADLFVQSLCNYSEVILFSAAYTYQGGTDHFNEQPHSYWAGKFAANNFVAFDLFRPIFWGNSEIEIWYRQNVFLYARANSEAERAILGQGHKHVSNQDFMNCIHPAVWESRMKPATHGNKLKSIARSLTPPAIWSIAKRLARFIVANKPF